MISIPPIDRDEARFAQATRQMIESGDYVRIYFQEEPRHKKPVGIYWLQAMAVSFFSDTEKNDIWPLRIPSVVGAILAVLGIYAAGRRLFNEKVALLGSMLLASSFIMASEAHMAKTDAALLACVAASQWALAALYMGEEKASRTRWSYFFLFWTTQGAGILLKGPIVPFISLFTLLCLGFWDRKWGWLRGLRPFLGFPLLCLLVLPWAAAVWKATDGSFFQDALREDFFPKLVSGHESHGAPPGFYLLLLPVFFWPAASLLGLTGIHAWKDRASPGVRFCLCWLLPAWLVFEAVPTKLPHYVLPLYPALALLSAHTILKLHESSVQWPRFWPRAVPLVLVGLSGVVVTATALALPWILEGRPSVAGILAATVGTAVAVQGIRFLLENKILHTVSLCLLGNVLVLGLFFQFVLPKIDSIWMSRTLQTTITRMIPPERLKSVRIASAGYHEPSLVFFMGTDTFLTSPEGAAQFLSANPDGISIVWEREEEGFFQQAETLGLKVKRLGSVEGINYSKGRKMALGLYANDI